MSKIRPEKLVVDEKAIYALHRAAFPTDAEARLVDRLRANGHSIISLVAELDGKVVGHVLFSPVTAGLSQGLGLAPLAVLPSYRRQGIGSALVWEGLTLCKGRTCEFVVVLGDPSYYFRFGFQPSSQFGMQNEFGKGDSFMLRFICPEKLCANNVARYGSEFAEWKVI
jgi:putative acetyltransferase